MKNSALNKSASILKILGNAKRLEILYHISDKELNVGQLERAVKLSQSALSQHLAVLRKAGIVNTRRNAQTIFYSLNDPNILQILQTIEKIYS